MCVGSGVLFRGLDLRGNHLGDAGLDALLSLLVSGARVSSIDLRSNKVTSDGIAAAVDVLRGLR